jgi:hypothetical protein
MFKLSYLSIVQLNRCPEFAVLSRDTVGKRFGLRRHKSLARRASEHSYTPSSPCHDHAGSRHRRNDGSINDTGQLLPKHRSLVARSCSPYIGTINHHILTACRVCTHIDHIRSTLREGESVGEIWQTNIRARVRCTVMSCWERKNQVVEIVHGTTISNSHVESRINVHCCDFRSRNLKSIFAGRIGRERNSASGEY